MFRLSLFVSFLFSLLGCSSTPVQSRTQSPSKDWALALHGGAGSFSKTVPVQVRQAYEQELQEALDIGSRILEQGGSSVDAVEQVIVYLENSPKFNAGKGSVYTHEGAHELDAAMMLGAKRQAGATCALTTVKNPIRLARRVMQESQHVILVAEGAENFAAEQGIERVDPSYFDTKAMREALERAREREELSFRIDEALSNEFEHGEKYGTVGCVALDRHGHLVAGTSTGGLTNKRYGRVGDVPIIGAGTYADENVAVSMTGWGEKILLAVSGHRVACEMGLAGRSLEDACTLLLEQVLEEGDAGIIAVDRQGNLYTGMNTQAMFRASTDSSGQRTVGIW